MRERKEADGKLKKLNGGEAEKHAFTLSVGKEEDETSTPNRTTDSSALLSPILVSVFVYQRILHMV